MSHKTCTQCGFNVPQNANVCGHCGAHFVRYRDKSISTRLFAACVMGLGCGFLFPIMSSILGFTSDGALGFAFTVGGVIGAVYGWMYGMDREYSTFD